MNKDQILAALTKLDRADLLAISAACSALAGQVAPPQPPPVNDPQAWLYEALTGVLGVNRQQEAFMNTLPGREFAKKAPEVIKFLKDVFPIVMSNKIAAQAMMRWLVEMIVADLKGRRVPVSIGIVIRNMGRARQIFEDSFPNYIQSGLTDLIIKHLVKERKDE